MAFWPPIHGVSNPFPMVYRTPPHGISNTHGILTPYPWYIEPLTYGNLTPYSWGIEPNTHGMSNLLAMVFRTPDLWNTETPPMVFWPTIHVFMVYRTPSPWYIEPLPVVSWPPIHDISNPLLWYYEVLTHGIANSLFMVYWIPYPWYIETPNNGISNHLPMVLWSPYPWYIEPPTYGISNTVLWYYEPPTHSISIPLYPWHIESPIHGISNLLPLVFYSLPMVYRTPYPWYSKPPLMVLWTPLFLQKWGGSIYHDGVQTTKTKIWPRGK